MYYEFMRDDYPTCIGTDARFSVIIKNKSLSPNVRTYSFRYRINLTSSKMFEIAEWCDENIKDNYLIGCATSGFKNKLDAMAFKMRWL